MYTRLIIAGIREETRNFKTIIFENGHGLSYRSGQFLTLIDFSTGSELRRSYSICSSPVLNEPLTIAVKRIDNGFFSRKLVDHARKGDILMCSGIAGFFCLPDTIQLYKKVFFFAAGSGITPVLSLIKTLLYGHSGISIHLVYSNPSVETTAFYFLLHEMQSRFQSHLQIDFLISSEADLRRARLNRDLLLEFISVHQAQKNGTLFYTCGPDNYMRMIIFLLIEEGFPRENIRKEDFNPGRQTHIHREPPDKHDYEVKIRFRENEFRFIVHYPDSILRAAQKQKLNLPYSCETGKCGSCAAACVSGSVWLSNNEVLTEKELTQGLTLTCTGHPQNGPVVLRIP